MLRIVKGFAPWILIDFFEEKFLYPLESRGGGGGPLGFMRLIRVGILQRGIRAKSVSYMISPFSPYLGALEVQFALGSFYTFVALSLMVLYELESIHLIDSNLIYSQNKNKGFYKKFDSIPFKNPTFSFFCTTIPQNRNTSIINMKVIQNHSITLVLVVWNLIPQNPR